MEAHVAADPIAIGPFGAQAVVAQADALAQLVEEAGIGRAPRQGDCGEGCGILRRG